MPDPTDSQPAELTSPSPQSDAVKALADQIEVAKKKAELIAAEKALASAQQTPSTEVQSLQTDLEVTNKKNEVLAAQLKTVQTQKSILSEAVPTAGATKPNTGEITTDETKRFLSEVVANEGLSKVCQVIADSIGGLEKGGILIVDDLAVAAHDFVYLDIKGKIDTLTKLTEATFDQCKQSSKPPAKPETKSEESDPAGGRKHIVAATIASATTILTAISTSLSVLGDIVGYFRANHQIKGQTLEKPDDLYIEALLAEKLRAKQFDVYLRDFQSINQSALLLSLNNLLEKKFELLTCSETLNSKQVAGVAAKVSALETHLASLKAKLVENLDKVKSDVIASISGDIDKITKSLDGYQHERIPASQITALENHLTALRTKLVDELTKDSPAAKAELEQEINKIIEKLDDDHKAKPDTKLSETKTKALNEQLKLFQTRLADVVETSSRQTASLLKDEIRQIEIKLAAYQQTRIPDSQILILETHLTNLQAKQLEAQAANVDETIAGLQNEIANITWLIEHAQTDMQSALAAVNSATKVIEAIDAFITNITTLPTGGAYPPLIEACIQETLVGVKIKYILKTKLQSSGADFMIHNKLPIPGRQPDTTYLGGGIVSYVLAEKTGKIVASGTVADGVGLRYKLGNQPEWQKWNVRSLRP